jgi:hypothetical protein
MMGPRINHSLDTPRSGTLPNHPGQFRSDTGGGPLAFCAMRSGATKPKVVHQDLLAPFPQQCPQIRP